MADIYIDNLHKQLYAVKRSEHTTVGGSEDIITVGLSDFGELPGQSTWHIRSVKFSIKGYCDVGSSVNTNIRICGGVIARDLATGPYPELEDYQDVAGWPLKGVYDELHIPTKLYGTPPTYPDAYFQSTRFSWTKTYKPSKNLSLNREQNFLLTLKNINGEDVSSTMMMYIHAERGD